MRSAIRGMLFLVAVAAGGCSSDPTQPSTLPFVLRHPTRTSTLDNVPVTVKFDDFSDVSAFQFNGTAAQSANSLRLNDNITNTRGSTFYTAGLALQNAESFSTYFHMHISDCSASCADGLVFVVQGAGATALGPSGYNLGYAGVTPSFAVEFDMVWNPPIGDLDAQHLGTHLNGDMSKHLAYVTNATAWQSGFYSVFIDYDGPNQLLEVRVAQNDDARPDAATLTETIDLESALGTGPLFMGFAAGTGNRFARHWIDAWYFRDDYAPIDIVHNTYVQGPRTVNVTATPASGSRAPVIQATVLDADGTPRAQWPVALTTDQGTLSATNATTDLNGQVSVTLQAGAADGIAHVVVTADGGANGSVDVGLLANPSITVTEAGPGSVTPSGLIVVPFGASTTFELRPAAHASLQSLRVDGATVTPAPSYAFTNVSSSHLLDATFALDSVTVSASSKGQGTITPAGAQVVAYGSSVSFAFTHDSRHRIVDVKVDGISVGVPEIYSFENLTESHTLEVSFLPSVFRVAVSCDSAGADGMGAWVFSAFALALRLSSRRKPRTPH